MKSVYKRHIIVFFLTFGIFSATFLFVSFENKLKREEIIKLQENILIDLMANETQFDLLKSAPCDSIAYGSRLSKQMDEIGEKLSFAEQVDSHENMRSLKKYYSLLEIKDYLLSEQLKEQCPDEKIQSIVYFYKSPCKKCTEEGYVLSRLKSYYPWLRIYSFDMDLDFPIIQTFADLYKVKKEELPVLILNGKKISGFVGLEEIQKNIPELIKEKVERKIQDEMDLLKNGEVYCEIQNKKNKKEIFFLCFLKGKNGEGGKKLYVQYDGANEIKILSKEEEKKMRRNKKEPPVGLEPTTYGLQNRCSTN